jgi:hypothetical protein
MELIPGFLQGITRVFISYPFDYIRTNLQTQKYSSILDYIKKDKPSLRMLYRGSSIPFITVPIDRSIQFSIFERLSKNNPIILSSFIASIVSSIYATPISYISTQVITQNKNIKILYKNITDISIYYRGYRAEFSRSMIGSTLYTFIYGTLRSSISKENHNYFIFGCISSIGSWSVVYPFDTMRVIAQTSDYSYANIIKNTPFNGFYKGFSVVVMRSIPSAGCGMVVYEKSKQLLL